MHIFGKVFFCYAVDPFDEWQMKPNLPDRLCLGPNSGLLCGDKPDGTLQIRTLLIVCTMVSFPISQLYYTSVSSTIGHGNQPLESRI